MRDKGYRIMGWEEGWGMEWDDVVGEGWEGRHGVGGDWESGMTWWERRGKRDGVVGKKVRAGVRVTDGRTGSE